MTKRQQGGSPSKIICLTNIYHYLSWGIARNLGIIPDTSLSLTFPSNPLPWTVIFTSFLLFYQPLSKPPAAHKSKPPISPSGSFLLAGLTASLLLLYLSVAAKVSLRNHLPCYSPVFSDSRCS